MYKASEACPLCADFPWLCCPRAALAKVLDLAQSKFGFTFRVGYESEFMLLHRLEPGSQPPFRPVDNSVYSQSSAFDAMAPGTWLREYPNDPSQCFKCMLRCVLIMATPCLWLLA